MSDSDADDEPGGEQADPWWEREPLRLLQPNLREVDADLNVDMLFEHIARFDANSLLVNTGRVCSFYPTGLEYQPRETSLTDRSDSDISAEPTFDGQFVTLDRLKTYAAIRLG